MNGVRGWESDCAEYVEVDPTGRYGRYNQVLGKGACKIVYKAFDEYEGIEVAWNQVKLTDFLQKPEDLERLYSEIHLLKTLKHSNIMKFYASWVDISNRNINFVTEMFTSGTLRQYRLKHKKVNIRAVKHWCRQILKGLLYLHNLDPPVIHRDLKCDNIFINGNQGQVKIGDLGLAAILRQSHAARCVVGTPEFMAPEVYAEEYNELVDIYSFGMCVLEMVTFEYPYSECTHPAQIYKKVISGKRPESLYKVKDPEVRQFVEKCLATVSSRLPARELLKDPFLKTEGKGYDLGPIDYLRDYEEETAVPPLVREVPFATDNSRHHHDGSLLSSCSDYEASYEHEDELITDCEAQGGGGGAMSPDLHVFSSPNAEITIKGTQKEDGDIFLRLRIADREGRVRNIYFPFDLENDTALSVANEMVSDLDITVQDAVSIADIIDGEIASLVPDWTKAVISNKEEEHEPGDEDKQQQQQQQQQQAAPSPSPPPSSSPAKVNGKHQRSASYLSDYVLPVSPYVQNLQVLHCSGHAPSRGRFEEVTYKVESPTEHHLHQLTGKEKEDLPMASPSKAQSIGKRFSDVMALHDDVCDSFKRLSFKKHDRLIVDLDVVTPRKDHQIPQTPFNSPATSMVGADYENEIRQELRWLKAKYQMQLRELRDQQLMAFPGFREQQNQDKPPTSEIESGTKKKKKNSSSSRARKKFATFLAPGFHHDRKPGGASSFRNCSSSGESLHGIDDEPLDSSKNFCNDSLLPHSLHRATSLPVDAVDC